MLRLAVNSGPGCDGITQEPDLLAGCLPVVTGDRPPAIAGRGPAVVGSPCSLAAGSLTSRSQMAGIYLPPEFEKLDSGGSEIAYSQIRRRARLAEWERMLHACRLSADADPGPPQFPKTPKQKRPLETRNEEK
jgi:hypothetical protein